MNCSAFSSGRMIVVVDAAVTEFGPVWRGLRETRCLHDPPGDSSAHTDLFVGRSNLMNRCYLSVAPDASPCTTTEQPLFSWEAGQSHARWLWTVLEVDTLMTTTEAIGFDEFAREWSEWHQTRDETFGGPHGFLAITNIHWLSALPEGFSDAPGQWRTGPTGVSVDLPDGEELLIDGTAHRDRVDFGVIAERASIFALWGEAAIEVAKRGGYDLIRPRHPDNPLRAHFAGTPTFDPHPRWVVEGRFVRFAEPRPVTVGAVVDGLEHVYMAPGRIEFEFDGAEYSLTAFAGRAEDTLTVLFNDATSGTSTYAANRGIWLPMPGADGRVTLDFNRAINLPCAYTDLATCPLPPEGNRLPFAVYAGEKTPRERQPAAPIAQTARPPLPEVSPRLGASSYSG